MAIRSHLRWLLAGTVALSALALWWPDPTAVPAPEPHGQAPAKGQAPLAQAPAWPVPSSTPLPPLLPTTSFEKARFDPFAGAQPPPPPTPKPVPVVVAPIETPPPRPLPPALNYRYLGRMSDPSGAQQVYLAINDTAVVVSVGTRLDEGYIVEALEPAGIRLHYPPLDAHALIPVPVVQDQTFP